MSRPDDLRSKHAELRFNEDGTVDDLLIRDSTGRYLFHMEQMDDGLYWMRAYTGGDEDFVVWLNSKSRIVATHDLDSAGRKREDR